MHTCELVTCARLYHVCAPRCVFVARAMASGSAVLRGITWWLHAVAELAAACRARGSVGVAVDSVVQAVAIVLERHTATLLDSSHRV